MSKLVNILLQKSDPEYPWGFSLGAQPPARHSVQITWVDNGSLASEHLEAGDRVLEIEGIDTTTMSNSEVESLLKNPSKKLELLIMKKPKVKISPFDAESVQTEVKNVYEETRRKTEVKEVKKDFWSPPAEQKVTEVREKKEDKFWKSPPPDLQQKCDFVTQSAIFQNLNRYKNENRKDPREEKRKFWESCRKGDSVRRFKWGDVKRVSSPYAKSDGSTESLYFKSETSSERREERSKSCEPFVKKELSPTNPFSAHYCEPKHSQIPEIKVTEHKKVHFENDFNSKYEFFEKTMSVPISVHKNAVGIVEEALKDPMSKRDSLPTFENKETKVRRFSNPSCLKKPSDFINQNRKTYVEPPKSAQIVQGYKKEERPPIIEGKQDHAWQMGESAQNVQGHKLPEGRQDHSWQMGVSAQNVQGYKKEVNERPEMIEGRDHSWQMGESAQNVQGYKKEECPPIIEGKQDHAWQMGESAQNVQGHKLPEGRQDHSWQMGVSAQNVQGYKKEVNERPEMIEGRDHSWQMGESAQNVQGYKNEERPQMIEGRDHAWQMGDSAQNVQGYKKEERPQMIEGRDHTWQMGESAQNVQGHKTQVNECLQMTEGRQDHSWQMGESAQNVQGHKQQVNECLQRTEGRQDHSWRESSQNVQGCTQEVKQEYPIEGGQDHSWQEESTKNVYKTQEDQVILRSPQVEGEQDHSWQEESAQNAQGYTHEVMLQDHSWQETSQNVQQKEDASHDSRRQVNCSAQNQDSHRSRRISPSVERMRKKEFVEYEHKKRTFTESSYEKVTRCPRSPYENVESAFRREYKEEDLKPFKSVKDRSKTPSGFYDNEKPEIPPETYENIRAKLGQLLGGTVIRPAKRIERKEDVEEAYRELTLKEGLLDDVDYEYYYERQSSQIAANNGSSIPAPHDMSGVPPPPPPPVQGSIPPVRIASEIGPKKHYEPPAAIQNAMMTKDKKPFTYTPGGLDLAEIRSPRMARRINRNAHMEDSCTPQMHQRPAGAQQPLPPSALAAMQPQIAIPVFPPGGGFQSNNSPPFPPPPPPMMPSHSAPSDNDFPPPPPPLQSPGTPSSAPFPPSPPPPMPENGRPSYLNDIQSHPPLRSVGQRPDFIAEIPSHPPLKPTNQPPRSSYDPNNSNPIQIQLKPVSPKPVQNTGPPYIPTQPIYVHQKPPEVLYKENAQPVKTPETTYQKPEMSKPPPLQMPQPAVKQQTPPLKTPQTPNKSPAPWMTTRQISKESPPPWTVKSPAESPQPSQPVTRVIPIQIEGEQKAQQQYQPQYQQAYQQSYQQAYQPPVYQQQNNEEPRTRIIPIQIEGAEQRNYGTQQSVNNVPNFQRSTSADGRQLQSQNSWSPNPIQSRSFRVLQKITGSEEEPIGPFHNPGAETFLVDRVRAAPVGDCSLWDPNCPSPYPYWYFPPQTPEEQQKFWEHYGAMCAYMAQMNAAARAYSPYPFVMSDSEGGYSSSDEMTYYGQMFKMQQKMEAHKEDTEEKPNPLQSIKSVPDINVYNSDESSDSDSDDSDDSELPLSTILEDSEEEKPKSENSSTSTLNEEAVVVRLPLKVKISVENNEEVATVIVGDEIAEKEAESLIITDIVREHSDPDVTATIKLKRNSVVDVSVAATVESPDFWNEIGSEDDSKQDSDCHYEDDSSSTSVQTVKKGEKSEESESEESEESDDQSEESEEDIQEQAVDDGEEQEEEEEEEEQAVDDGDDEDDADDADDADDGEEEEEESESSEEEAEEQKVETKEESEDDSGVTDISRHETDTSDPESERRKTHYKRAATHSRLFKLLQDECASDEEPSSRKERLTLPLNKSEETLSSSSGINSPLSPTVTERAVKELVQSLLSRKKGRNFRKLPLEKLHAAALRILQEDMEHESSDEFLSPDSIPKRLTEEYRDYYESWANHDIVPSKTFRILDSPSPSPKITVRCPRVLPETPE